MYKNLLFVFSLLTGSILNAQPSPVTIVLPKDGSTAITSPVNFIWNKSPLALAYTIQISIDNLFGSTIVNQSISDTTYSTSILQTSTKYYWRVRAENIIGASIWTNAMFTTKLNIPSL
jgi:titin